MQVIRSTRLSESFDGGWGYGKDGGGGVSGFLPARYASGLSPRATATTTRRATPSPPHCPKTESPKHTSGGCRSLRTIASKSAPLKRLWYVGRAVVMLTAP